MEEVHELMVMDAESLRAESRQRAEENENLRKAMKKEVEQRASELQGLKEDVKKAEEAVCSEVSRVERELRHTQDQQEQALVEAHDATKQEIATTQQALQTTDMKLTSRAEVQEGLIGALRGELMQQKSDQGRELQSSTSAALVANERTARIAKEETDAAAKVLSVELQGVREEFAMLRHGTNSLAGGVLQLARVGGFLSGTDLAGGADVGRYGRSLSPSRTGTSADWLESFIAWERQ